MRSEAHHVVMVVSAGMPVFEAAVPGARDRRDWYLSLGVPAEELGEGDCLDRLEDPTGAGPSIWFQPVPEGKPGEPRIGFMLPVVASVL